ncbi:MAG: hypothetical protein P8X90_36595 [Desulfobacterales bacterium]
MTHLQFDIPISGGSRTVRLRNWEINRFGAAASVAVGQNELFRFEIVDVYTVFYWLNEVKTRGYEFREE